MGEECLRSPVYRRRKVRRERGAGGGVAGYRPCHDDEDEQSGFQDREACPQLSALLAYGQTDTLLSARQLVYSFHCLQGKNDGTE